MRKKIADLQRQLAELKDKSQTPNAATPAPANNATPATPVAPIQSAALVPVWLVEQSEVVGKAPDGTYAVATKDGKPVDGVKLSKQDTDIPLPDITVGNNGTIHTLFVEQLSGKYEFSLYYRASSDGGKSWSEPMNPSDIEPEWFAIGHHRLAVDGAERVYAIWKRHPSVKGNTAGEIGGWNTGNLVYRVLENGKWSNPVNVTNHSLHAHSKSNINGLVGAATESWHMPGCVSATFDKKGHVQIIMVNNEFGMFGTTALGVQTSSGTTRTPRLYYLGF